MINDQRLNTDLRPGVDYFTKNDDVLTKRPLSERESFKENARHYSDCAKVTTLENMFSKQHARHFQYVCPSKRDNQYYLHRAERETSI
jgi:hypothetical protein